MHWSCTLLKIDTVDSFKEEKNYSWYEMYGEWFSLSGEKKTYNIF